MTDLISITLESLGIVVSFIIAVLEITSSNFKGFFKRLDFMKNLIYRISEKDKNFEKFMDRFYSWRFAIEFSLFFIIWLIMMKLYSPLGAGFLIIYLGIVLMFLPIIIDIISSKFLKTNKSEKILPFLTAFSLSRINEIINSLIIIFTGTFYLLQEITSHHPSVIINFLIIAIAFMSSLQFWTDIIGLIHILNPFEKHPFSRKPDSLAIKSYFEKIKGGNFLMQISVGISNGIVVTGYIDTGYIEHTGTQLTLKKDEDEFVYIPWSDITYYSFHLN